MSSMFGGRHALRAAAAASGAIPSAARHRIPAVARQHSRQYSRGPNPKQGTRTHWYWIPVGAGLAYISAQRLYHLKSDHSIEPSADGVTVPGPWQLHVLSALPLKAISRFFGSFNELEIPVVLRSPLLRIYATIFGCQLDEMKDPVLTHYPNLATFFYRELKDGVRPVNTDADVVVSPSDGKVLHFGVVEQREVEQVKGLTYSLDAFFGRPEETNGIAASTMVDATLSNSHNATADDDFAVVNGIPYTLDTLIGPDALPPALQSLGTSLRDHERLFFCVIYLAPGDYHRFHSPVNWVVEARRHFAGELYSVSPYIARTVGNLFVLNERVALLGRWKHGFMSMTAVGATNVGSVVVNFDKELRTNLKEGKVVPGDFSQLSYRMINPALAGVPLRKGQEVGGFRLGSTVVLVFSAPQDFTFDVKADQTVRMGEALGTIPTG